MRHQESSTSFDVTAFPTARSEVYETAGPSQISHTRPGSEASANRSVGWLFQKRQLASARLAQLIKFLLVGGMGMVINSLVLFLAYQLLRLPLVIASLFSVELAIVNNFIWNDRWTFAHKKSSLRRFLKFNLVSFGGLAITTGTLWALVTHLATPYLFANLVGICLATSWNFCLSLLWTWGRV